jgi:SNF2 family DNA or RNA helicase
MFSLFRFLEVPVLQNQQRFNESFGSNGNEQAQRMQVLLRSLMLRRKKDEKINGRPLIVLPEKVTHFDHRLTNQTIVEDRIEFDKDERSLYTAVEARARVQVNKYLREGVAMKNYSSMLAMVVRLRQVFPFHTMSDISSAFIHT